MLTRSKAWRVCSALLPVWRSRSGLAAVEFALLLPVMIAFIYGGFEAVRGINAARRLTILANAVAQQVSAATAVSGTSYAEFSNADLHFFVNTAMVVFPQVLKDGARYGNYWWNNISVSISSVKFTPTVSGCTSNCTYVANVIWSSGAQPRSCVAPLQSQPDTAGPALGYLPADVFGPGTLIVVDVTYTFRPLVGGQFFGNGLTLKRSVYLQPRYVPTIYYQGMANDDIAAPCPLNAH